MAEVERLSQLIADVYDTVLDRDRWYGVLENTAGFVGGCASTLYTKNAVSKTGQPFYCWNIPDDAVREYCKDYSKIDPTTLCQFVFDVEELYSTSDCMPYDEFLATRFYKEWVQPRGWVDNLQTTLDKSATSFAPFGIFRSAREGLVDQEMRRRMRLIVPHVRRAVLIGNVIDLKTTEADALTDTFDGLSAGVFLLDANARIVFANSTGNAVIDDGRMLRREQDALVATDPQQAALLRGVVAAAANGDAAVGTGGIAIPLGCSHTNRWIAHVLPLTSGARRRAGIAYSAVAAVFVRQASMEMRSPMNAIADTYKLTASELRVLCALVEVSGIPAVADILGIAQSTVKTHLQHLFNKTGASRQLDLVKLVAAYASPLARPAASPRAAAQSATTDAALATRHVPATATPARNTEAQKATPV